MTKNPVNRFGRAVRKQRLEMGFGLRELARQVPMSPAYLSKIERGQFNPPGEEKIKKIADLLELDRDRLLALAGRLSSDLPKAILQDVAQWTEMVRNMKDLNRQATALLLDAFVSASRDLKRDPDRIRRAERYISIVRDQAKSRDSD